MPYTKRVMIRIGDNISIHHHIDAQTILSGEPAATLYDGPVTISHNGQHVTLPAADAIARVDSASNTDTLVTTVPEE